MPVYTPQDKQDSPMNNSSPPPVKSRPTLIHQNLIYESPKTQTRSNFIEQNSTVIYSQTKPIEKPSTTQNIYDEIDTALLNQNPSNTLRADLQFIRGTIDRILHFHHETPTEATPTHYEEVIDENPTSPKKLSSQYPAVEAVQRFYNHKVLPNGDRRNPMEQITNLDDIIISSTSASKKSDRNPPIINGRVKNQRKVDSERTSSEEVDDTLNDIEDVEYHHDDKAKRPMMNHKSTDTSNETSPLNSSNPPSRLKTFTSEIKPPERVCIIELIDFRFESIRKLKISLVS